MHDDKRETPLSMTVDEIVAMYKNAANKSKQIEILADMNPSCTKSQIGRLLESQGCEVPKPWGSGLGTRKPKTEAPAAPEAKAPAGEENTVTQGCTAPEPTPEPDPAPEPKPECDPRSNQPFDPSAVLSHIAAIERSIKDHADTIREIRADLRSLGDNHRSNIAIMCGRLDSMNDVLREHSSAIEHAQSDVNAIRERVSGIEDMLLPSVSDCPFCGDKSEVDSCWIRMTEERIDSYFVVCRSCGARSGNYPTKREAVEHWNPRTG